MELDCRVQLLLTQLTLAHLAMQLTLPTATSQENPGTVFPVVKSPKVVVVYSGQRLIFRPSFVETRSAVSV